MDLSIVIGTVDRPEQLNKFVTSYCKYKSINSELIILDAGEKLVTDTFDFSTRPDITVIREERKLGFAKGYNEGFKVAKGQYVTYLNDDCEVSPYWDIEAVRFMDSNKWVGMGAIYYTEYGAPGGYHISEWLNLPYANFGVISKELGDKLGWFDDYIHTYGADNSLSFKVFLEGLSVVGIPNCKISHSPLIDRNKMENIRRQPEDAANLLLRYRHRIPEMIATYKRYPQTALYANS